MIGTMVLVYRFAARHFSEQTAELSVAIMASSLLVGALGRLMMTDPLLLLALTGAMTTFWNSLSGNPTDRIWTGACIGFGVLAKGPVALLLFVPIALATYWRLPETRTAFRGHWIVAFALMSLLIGAWYVPAFLQNGNEFVQKFLVEQNLNRFTGGDAAHTAGPISLLMYPIVLIFGMFPWFFFAVPACLKSLRAPSQTTTYLAIWAVIIFAFFMASGAKLPHYILPCIPALAILAADELRDRRHVLKFALAGAAGCSILLNSAQIIWDDKSGQKEARSTILALHNSAPKIVAFYRLGRQNKALATGTTNLQETSLPSLFMYLNSTAIDTDNFGEILDVAPVSVFTRTGRIDT